MLRRVNLTILLCCIVVIVLSFGLSAGAQQEDEAQGDGVQEAELEDNSAGIEDGAVKEARREHEQLQWEVNKAHGERLNMDSQKAQIADEVADTQKELGEAEERSKEAEREFADMASEVYRNKFDSLLGVMVGAQSFQDFTDRLQFATQVLAKRKEAVGEANRTEEKLARELEERQSRLEKWETTVAEERDLEEQLRQAEDDVQAHLDGLDEQVRQEIQAEQDQQAELDRVRAQEILEKLAENESSGGGEIVQREVELVQEDGSDEAVGEPVIEGAELEVERTAPVQDLIAQTATEKLIELRDAEQKEREAEEDAAERVAEAERARLAAAEQQAEPQNKESEAKEPGEAQEGTAKEAEQARLDAEQAATEAAKQANAVEEERHAVEQAARQVLQEAKKAEQVAKLPVNVSGDADRQMNAGDRVVVEGDFEIEPGATVIFVDADGTRGRATDGENAQIVKGSIDTLMTGEPLDVSGGDGVLDPSTATPVDMSGINPGPAQPGLQDGNLSGEPVLGDPGLGDPLLGDKPGLDGQLNKTPAISGQPGLQPTTSPLAPTGVASGSAIVREAMSWLGAPYSFGGTSRDGISCSGLVLMTYGKFGISLPNSPEGQLAAVGPLKTGPAPAGAIVFFAESGGGPTHVGISNGDGTMTDANVVKGQVGITPIDVVTGYMGWGFPPGI